MDQPVRLGEMRAAGLLSEEEFAAAKQRLLNLTGVPALPSA